VTLEAPRAAPRVRILNVDLDNLDRRELLERFESGVVFTINVDFVVRMQTDREFLDLQRRAQFSVADGQMLVFASRFLGTPLKERIAGADLLPAFCEHHRNDPHIRIFLLGAGPAVAEAAMHSLNSQAGRPIVVGAHSPSYGFERNERECVDIVDLINQSGATVLAIALGAPKQEKWIAAWRGRLADVRMFLPVGAALDFAAGTKRRAPEWLGRAGLEWLFRLAQEPRRLWRRYLVDDPRFFRLVLQQRRGRYRDPFPERDERA
jgi:N-acetylglucosaminyldiphosphoundecaprenol N-acetyl-beta-D-mannosaminyltransferase